MHFFWFFTDWLNYLKASYFTKFIKIIPSKDTSVFWYLDLKTPDIQTYFAFFFQSFGINLRNKQTRTLGNWLIEFFSIKIPRRNSWLISLEENLID